MAGIIQSKKAERRRRKIAEAQGRLHQNVERRFERSFRSWAYRVRQDILGRLQAFGTVHVSPEELFDPRNHSANFSRKLLPRWNLAVWSGVQFEADWIDAQEARQSLQMLRQELQLPDDWQPPPSINVDPSEALMGDVKTFLHSRQVGVWGQVSRTTHNALNKAIRKGLAEGDDLDAMTKRIRKVLTNYNDHQARRVARTETTGAMNFGGQAERDELGIEFKEWVSTLDVRTRGADPGDRFDHLAADGQVVANGEVFTVSGERLLFPGDSSRGASGGNVIHCRCTAVANFDGPTNPPPKPKRKTKKKPPQPKVPKEKPPVIKPTAPEPPKPKVALDKKPAHLTFSGEADEFSERVWDAIGSEGIATEEHARQVGRMVREEIEKHPELAKAKKELAKIEKEIEDLRVRREAARKEMFEATEEESGKAYVKWDKLDREYEKLKDKVPDAQIAVHQSYPDAAKETLSKIRDMGYSLAEFRKNAKPKFSGGKSVVDSAEKALRNLPADWGKSIEEWATSGPAVKIGEVKRGYFNQYTREIKTSGIGKDMDSTMLHEFTHGAERNHKINGEKRIARLEREFLEHRRKPGEELVAIYKEHPDELGYKDEFLEHYMGKDYGHGDAYEVLTMGIESVFYYHAKRNVWDDADMMEFVLGILSGI